MEGQLVIELKAVKALAPEHEAQILGYLKSARLRHGLLINFGSYRFQIRKFVWDEETTTKNAKSTKRTGSGLVSALLALFSLS